jgi:hypothetical protein
VSANSSGAHRNDVLALIGGNILSTAFVLSADGKNSEEDG